MSSKKPLAEGDAAPEVDLETDSGERFRLSGLKGRNVVLYFFPKADTPGWTTEAREFRDAIKKLESRKATVVGISPDAVKAQAKFKAKQELPFTLLADVDHKAAEDYAVWVEKSMYGRKYMGIERTTFLVGPDGKVRKIFRKVKPAGHAAEVLEALS